MLGKCVRSMQVCIGESQIKQVRATMTADLPLCGPGIRCARNAEGPASCSKNGLPSHCRISGIPGTEGCPPLSNIIFEPIQRNISRYMFSHIDSTFDIYIIYVVK